MKYKNTKNVIPELKTSRFLKNLVCHNNVLKYAEQKYACHFAMYRNNIQIKPIY